MEKLAAPEFRTDKQAAAYLARMRHALQVRAIELRLRASSYFFLQAVSPLKPTNTDPHACRCFIIPRRRDTKGTQSYKGQGLAGLARVAPANPRFPTR